jgi:hypothetical protein
MNGNSDDHCRFGPIVLPHVCHPSGSHDSRLSFNGHVPN